METAFIVYGLCASALLVWSTLPHRHRYPTAPPELPPAGIEYFLISPALLDLWRINSPNLIILDVRDTDGRDTKALTCAETLPGGLRVRLSELPALLPWLPPRSVLVFRLEGQPRPLEPSVETTLLHIGIDIVFFLKNTARLDSESLHVQPAWRKRPDTLASRMPNLSGDSPMNKVWRYFP